MRFDWPALVQEGRRGEETEERGYRKGDGGTRSRVQDGGGCEGV